MCLSWIFLNRGNLMNSAELNKICRTVSGTKDDSFVGVSISEGRLCVNFPLGYALGPDDNSLRKDIITLLRVLENFSVKKQDSNQGSTDAAINYLPISSYIGVLQYYFVFGNYSETEVQYRNSDKGKISWVRTMKNKKPCYSDNGAVYLDFIVKDSRVDRDTMISQIFKYCVFISFQKIGWLYTKNSYPKPELKFNRRMFSDIVRKALNETFNDIKRRLFYDMLNIIDSVDNENADGKIETYGTENFQYIWEKMIDQAFGIKEKDIYFPKSSWVLADSKKINHCLEPDTIMINDSKIYILDAKYYKYGCTANLRHLPDTSSIQKQITYGEFAEKIFKQYSGKIFNAFMMPFCSTGDIFQHDDVLKSIGYAKTDWKDGRLSYEKIAGILLDTKYIMKNYLHCEHLKYELQKLIEKTVIN